MPPRLEPVNRAPRSLTPIDRAPELLSHGPGIAVRYCPHTVSAIDRRAGRGAWLRGARCRRKIGWSMAWGAGHGDSSGSPVARTGPMETMARTTHTPSMEDHS